MCLRFSSNTALCKISREALGDHLSERGRLRPEMAFEKHRREIEAVARKNTSPASANWTVAC